MHVAFWGETDMIISKLEIKRLYGMYDYCLSFFDDLTLLYGENGCGKTTVLDIVTSIVTGRIYNLTAYQFEQIKLYYKENKRSKTFQISIISDDLSYKIDIDTSSGKIHESISDINSLTEEYDRDRDESAFERKYYSQYRISDYLRKAFNYIYLPLSRESQEGFENSDLSYYRRISRRYSERDILNKSYLNTSLRFVEEMIRSSRMRINAGENRINARFRSSIFTSSLKVVDYNTTNISNLLKRTRDKNVLRSIENSKAEYIRTLKSVGEWNEDMEVQVSAFFEKYVEAFRKVQNQEGEKGTNTITVDFLLMDMEFNRIKEIAAQAQQIETEKKNAY